MRSEIEIFPLYFPSIVFSDNMLMSGNIFTVASPVVSIVIFYSKNRQFIHEPGAAFIRPSTVMPCENYTAFSLNRVPCPSLISLVSYITPKLISFCICPDFDFQAGKYPVIRQKIRIHLGRSFFLSSEITVLFEIPRFLLISLTPLLLRVCVSICPLMPGSLAL